MNLKEQWVQISNQPSLGEPFIAIDRDSRGIPAEILGSLPGILPKGQVTAEEYGPREASAEDALRAAVLGLTRKVEELSSSVEELKLSMQDTRKRIAEIEDLWFVRAWRWVSAKVASIIG